MRNAALFVALVVVSAAGCAAPPRATEAPRYSLRVLVAGDGTYTDPLSGRLAQAVKVDAALLRTDAETQREVAEWRALAASADWQAVVDTAGPLDTLTRGAWLEGMRVIHAPQLTLAVGQEGCLRMETVPGSRAFSLVDTQSEAWVVGRVHDGAICLRTRVGDFDPATHEGHVSFEMVYAEHTQIDAYFKAEDREFREGEVIVFEPTAPDGSEATAQRTATAL